MPENDAYAPKPEDIELEQPVVEAGDPADAAQTSSSPQRGGIDSSPLSAEGEPLSDGEGETGPPYDAALSEPVVDLPEESAVSPSDTGKHDPSKPGAKSDDKKGSAAPQRKGKGVLHLGRTQMQEAGGFLVSMILHAVVLIGLALWVLPQVIEDQFTPLVVETLDPLDEELETVELDESLEVGTEMAFSSAVAGPVEQAMDVSEPALEKAAVEESLQPVKVSLDASLGEIARSSGILQALPDGVFGQARSVVEGYGSAMDRITREILWMLEDSDVLVVWLFDESESMKDDQEEIAGRIARVYEELGLSGQAEGESLLTAICSYGGELHVQTEKPTSNLETIKSAIGAVPVDASGKESMCRAVSEAVNRYRRFATSGKRKLALIMVTDESGDHDGNVAHLEQAISDARSARCTVYILGREAVFGYPYAYIHWTHPQTGRPHWIRIDRGPETAFVEQLQTDGFERRHDAYSSGFGPYEQSRIARETGGIFFMLPSVESNLVHSEKRRYELEAMTGYLPDLRAREEIFTDRKKSKLQTLLWGVISTLNPYDANAAKVIELRVHFSPDFETFKKQVAEEEAKIPVYLQELARQTTVVEEGRRLRLEEPSPRWRANYDLLYAQLIAYQARVYEYGAYMAEFVRQPPVVPLKRPPNLSLTYWDLGSRKETLTGEKIKPYVEKATELFEQIIKDHPGTPWASRAQWELDRGYGIRLNPRYEPPYKDVTDPIPVPNY